jgi:hypothetical protein
MGLWKLSPGMYRRTVLATLGAVAVAGCLGDNDNDSSSGEENGTDNDTANDEDIPDAEQLLPQPEGYTLDERNPQAAGIAGANNGIQGVYSGQSVDSFSVEILVYEDTETAANNESLYTTWDYAIRVGTVLYAVNFLEQQEAIEVLAAVPELDRETVESNQI